MLIFSVFGIFLSYIDFKEKKVYNLHLIFMALAGLVLFAFGMYPDLYGSLLVNFLFAFFTGILFWKIGLWGAGDGKLFAICSFYLPFKMYLSFFYAQVILVNVFILAFLIWFLPLILKTKFSEKVQAFKQTFTRDNVLNLGLLIFGLFYFVGTLLSLLDLGLYTTGYIIALFIGLASYAVLRRFFSRNLTYILFVLCLARFFFDISIFTMYFWELFALTMAILLIAMWFGNLSIYISYDEKRLCDLEEGDVPIGVITTKGTTIELKKWLDRHLVAGELIMKKGFSKEDLGRFGGLKGIEGFLTKKTVCFTPLIIVAVLLVAILKVDILTYLLSEIHYHLLE